MGASLSIRATIHFHLDPLSDVGTEEYFAAFQLYEGDAERLGVGNPLKAYAYSAFNTATRASWEPRRSTSDRGSNGA
jgi:hypothetical protein